jgi:E3 ubiquitin-protein ligase HUWE1
LGHPWGTKEHGQDLLQLADEDVHIPEKLSGLNFQFYRTASLAKSNIDATATATGPTTSEAQSTSPTSIKSPTTATLAGSSSNTSPTKQRRFSHPGSSSTSTTPGATIAAAASEGLVTIHANNIRRFGASDYEILAHFVKEYDVPEEHRFSLLNRIRVATGVNIPQRRHQLLTIRILAIAVISHVLPEGDILDKLLAFEPDIIQSLTELIHPDHKAPIVSASPRSWSPRASIRVYIPEAHSNTFISNPLKALQTVALFALDGLAHLRSKQGDVLTAVNASASHGVLLYLLRKIINGMDSDNGRF